MVGISAYGSYIPSFRLKREVIGSAVGWLNPVTLRGEKAVANYDEDSITMAVAAGMNCLRDFERDKVEGLYFATTSPSYEERQAAAIIATALNFHPDIRTVEFAGSTSSGIAALLAAYDTVKAGVAKNIMVCVSDRRLAKPSSAEEQIYGDGAVALIVGDSGVVADLKGSYSVSYDFPGRWRAEYEKFGHSWEDRFVRDESYLKFITESISGLLHKYGLNINEFAKIIYHCPYAREHAAIGRRIGAEASQIQDHMLSIIGDTGTPQPLLMLVAALEEAKAGDEILIAGFGSGSNTLFLKTTEEIKTPRKGKIVKDYLASGTELTNYEKYVSWRNILPMEKGIRGEVENYFTPLSRLWRERKEILGLVGSKCKRCGTPQYPAQRVCVKPDCGAIDEMEEYQFSDKKGYLFTYTEDHLAFSINPPQIYGVVDFEGGGRYWFDLTDCKAGSLQVGMPVEMSFREKYFDEPHGIHGYFWKAVPLKI